MASSARAPRVSITRISDSEFAPLPEWLHAAAYGKQLGKIACYTVHFDFRCRVSRSPSLLLHIDDECGLFSFFLFLRYRWSVI